MPTPRKGVTASPAPATPDNASGLVRPRRRPVVGSDIGQRVTYTEAIQDEHDRRIIDVESKVSTLEDITQATMASATNVANRLIEFGQKMIIIEGRATEWHDWIEENRRRQPERDRKDKADSELLEKLAGAEDGRKAREAAAEQERTETAKVLADKLAKHEKRNTTLLRAASAAMVLLLAALSPSVVSQFPSAARAAGYSAYAVALAITVIVVVIATFREGK